MIIIFTGALVAALCGVPALNRRLTAPRLGWILSVVPLSAFVVFGAALPLYRVDWVFPNRRKPDNMEIDMVSDFNLTIKAVFSN